MLLHDKKQIYNDKYYLLLYYYCIFLNLTKLMGLNHIMLHTATLSSTLVNPKYPNPNRALTKISPLIL